MTAATDGQPSRSGHWVQWPIAMQWKDLAFLHWTVPRARLGLPAGVECDLWEGQAWIGVVPFAMQVRARGLPAVPGLSTTLELNVRTYVRAGGEVGIWFYSLDAGHPLLVRAGRWAFQLPYFNARMTLARDGDWVIYQSQRMHPNASSAEFCGRYRPLAGPAATPAPGTLEHWLTERYCFFTADRRGRLFRCQVRHAPWTLQAGECDLERVDMFRQMGLTVPESAPLCHVARPLEVLATRLLSAGRLGAPSLGGWDGCGNCKNIAVDSERR
jgi:uncharacterized protein YqjF (DUF2071 family)